MSARQHIAKANIDQIAQRLRALPDVEAPCSAYETVLELAPVIENLRQRGHQLDVVVEALAGAGIVLKRSTVGRYLSRALRERSSSALPSGALSKASAAPSRAAPPPARLATVLSAPPTPPGSHRKGSFTPRPDTDAI